MFEWQELTLFLYITARVSGFVLFNPILGRNSIPAIVRTGFILVLAFFISSVTHATVATPPSTVAFGVRLLLELAIGYVLGMVMQFFFFIPQMTGLVVDTQMGLTMNQIYDAGSQANLSVSAVFLNAMMILLFFAANGHHTLMRIFVSSADLIPFGTMALNYTTLVEAMLELFISCIVLAAKMSMPIIAAELLGQLGMGVLMKAIPQINVFTINIELKVIIGLVLLLVLLSPFSEFFLQMELEMLNKMQGMLQLLGA